jgi:uncharacterized protein (TIGR01732 family)
MSLLKQFVYVFAHLPCDFLNRLISYRYVIRKGVDRMSSENEKNVGNFGCGSGFALIVVLFILLIIVGAAFIDNGFDGGYGYC